MRVAFVSNEPPPYRIPVFDLAAREPGLEFMVLFCCRREPNRQWDLPPMLFPHVFLRENIYTVKGRYIHNNPDVLVALRRFAPDVVVTDGFNPTHLYAFLYAWTSGRAHVAMTDGTDVSEQTLGTVHRAIRRFVYGRTRAFVAASDGGLRLFDHYGIPREAMHKSCLCIDNQAFQADSLSTEKAVDFLFSGRLEEVKNPYFAIDVAVATAKRIGRQVSLLFVGAGSEERALWARTACDREYVELRFHGFASQKQLPQLYRSARVFLFPTRWDPWGVVVNEACAAGLPILISPHAGAAGELVRDGCNGFVCSLDVDTWAERAAQLLQDVTMYQRFSEASTAIVRDYSYRNAASGIVTACRQAALQMNAAAMAGRATK